MAEENVCFRPTRNPANWVSVSRACLPGRELSRGRISGPLQTRLVGVKTNVKHCNLVSIELMNVFRV